MSSRISLYNRGVGRNLLRRYWPLWAAYLLVMIAVGPMSITAGAQSDPAAVIFLTNQFNRSIMNSALLAARIQVPAAALMAMAMYNYLYNPRSCGLMNTLPLRRETTFLTAFFTGLVPMLVIDGIAFGLVCAVAAGKPGADAHCLWLWLGTVTLANVAFYGMASFCAVLTGNVLVLPAVYLVLGCTVTVVEGTVRALLGTLVYGYTYQKLLLTRLSPVEYVVDTISVTNLRWGEPLDMSRDLISYRLTDFPYFIWIALAGLALTALAVRILRRRQMERAGDVVAVPVLRPVFRLCMAFGCALVLAVLMDSLFFQHLTGGTTAAVLTILMLLAGAFIGYFGSEMLMKKTLRVFHSGWKQLGIVAACLLVFALCAELDVTGYERYVPAPDQIADVRALSGVTPLTDAETVELYRALHQGIIDHKRENEAARSTYHINLHYTLKDGQELYRVYEVARPLSGEAAPDADLSVYERLLNCQEVRMTRFIDRPITEDEIYRARIDTSAADGDDESISLTREQAAALYNDCILPDAEDGTLGLVFLSDSETARREETNAVINLEVWLEPDASGEQGTRYFSFWVLKSAERTCRWLEENLGLTPELNRDGTGEHPAFYYY